MKVKMYSVRQDEQAAIAVNAKLQDATVDTVAHDFTAAEVPSLAGYDVLCLAQHHALGDEATYQQLAAIGVHHIALRITGYDIIDLAAARANGIKVTNVPAYSPRSVGEMTLAHTLKLMRHLGEVAARANKGDYSWGGLEAAELHTLTVGVIGAGKIGSTTARLFKALGATVVANDPVMRPELSDVLTYVDLPTLLAQADIVTLHTPLDDGTHHLIDAAALKQMKPSALLINCARGPIVDTDALLAALEAKTIAGAGLDTLEGEAGIFGEDLSGQPIANPALLRLQALPNVSLSPHIAFYTAPAVANMVAIALKDAHTLFTGGTSPHELGD